MVVAGQPEDDPSVPPEPYEDFRVWCALGQSGSLMQTWLASDDGGEPAGAYVLDLPQIENRKNGFAHIILSLIHI